MTTEPAILIKQSTSTVSFWTLLDVLGSAFDANRVLGGSSTLAPKAISSLRDVAERV